MKNWQKLYQSVRGTLYITSKLLKVFTSSLGCCRLKLDAALHYNFLAKAGH